MAHSVGSGERLREALADFEELHMIWGGMAGSEHPDVKRSHDALDRLMALVDEFLQLYEKNQHDLHDREKELASARRELVGSAGSLGTTHNFLQFDEFITRVHQFNSGSKAPSLTPLIEKLADLSSLRYPVGKEDKSDSKIVAIVVNALVALCLEAAARYVAIHRHTFAAAAATVPVGCPTAPVPAPAPATAGPAQPPPGAAAAAGAEFATELRPSPAALAHVAAIPLFASTWRKLCEAVFGDVFAFPRMAAEVVTGPFAAFLAAAFPAVSEEVFADRKLRDAVTACAAEACYLGAWGEVSNSHITVAVPAVLPPGSLVPREAPAPPPAADADAAARDPYGAPPALWMRQQSHSVRLGLGRLGGFSDLMGMGHRGMGAGHSGPPEPPLPEGWLRVDGVPYGPAEGEGPVPLTLPALRKEAMSLLTYDFEFEDEVDKCASHVVYPVGLVIRLRKGEGEAAAAAGGAGTPAAAATSSGASASGDVGGMMMSLLPGWGDGLGGRAAAAAPAATLPPVAALFGSGRFAITAPALALHSPEAGKRKVQVLPGMTRAPAPPGGAAPAGRSNASRAAAAAASSSGIGGALSAGSGGSGGWAGEDDDDQAFSAAVYGGGAARAGASGRVVSGGGGFAASTAARSGVDAGAGGAGDAAARASMLRAAMTTAAGRTSASASASSASVSSASWLEADSLGPGPGPGGVRRPYGYYGDDVVDGLRSLGDPSAAATTAAGPPGSRPVAPPGLVSKLVGGSGGVGRRAEDAPHSSLLRSVAGAGRGSYGALPAGRDRDTDALAAALAGEEPFAQARTGEEEYMRALVAMMRDEAAAARASVPASAPAPAPGPAPAPPPAPAPGPAPAPAPAAAVEGALPEPHPTMRSAEAGSEPHPTTRSAESAEAGTQHGGLLRSLHGPSDSSTPPPADRLHSRFGRQHHHIHGAAAAGHHGAAAGAAARVAAGMFSEPSIYGAAPFGNLYGPSAPVVGGIRSARLLGEDEAGGERTDTDGENGEEEEEDDDDGMPSLQDERVEAEAADAVVSSGSGRHAHSHLSVHGSGSAFAAPAAAATAPAAASPAADATAVLPAPSAAGVSGPAAREAAVAAATGGPGSVASEGHLAAQRDDTASAAPTSAQPATDSHRAAAAASGAALAGDAAETSADGTSHDEDWYTEVD